ncbi:T9SS type A sorting domain-containing protein [Adhaeribacter soli]|uniref:T9SS type A sorting domain-containing protein n=1 Tax=Adhaeribacter soli TaxID=2607655 RepID=A0A5N1IJ33_9BACT|nr:T9SS type A sorting domain-containing protein [Adhaeribacter soli]KAA9325418.1 T9SS type A sorting domain-containing protein [Adhaeribacter soli]
MKKAVNRVCFLLLLVLNVSLPFICVASCSKPVTIYSAKDGDFTTASTWVGGIVPSSCDNVVIRHKVRLNQGFTIGNNQNIAGALTIDPNSSLTDANNTLSITLNSVVTNNGTLQIAGLNFWGNNAAFRNYGTATLTNAIAANSLSQIYNYGSLTLNNNLDQNGNTFINYEGAVATVKGELKLQNGGIEAVLQNYGVITVERQVTVNQGAISNEPMGEMNMLGSMVVNSGSGKNKVSNKGAMSVGQDFKTNPVSYVYNSGRMTIKRDLDNRSAFVNDIGTVEVMRDFYQGNQQGAKFENNDGGLVDIYNNFWNDGLITGNGGMYVIKGVSTITANGKFAGNIDICDQSRTSGNIDNLSSQSSIGKEVTFCSASRFMSPLPVKLLSFTGSTSNGNVILKWQTAQEENSRVFLVEQSLNGVDFVAIGSVDAAGNSNVVRNYKFEARAAAGLAYYRLKMVDLDASFEYSGIIAVKQQNETTAVKIYPQPAQAGQELSVELPHVVATTLNVEIVTLQGRLLQSRQLDTPSTRLQVKLPTLTPGVYFLQISGAGQYLVRSKILVN